jgi:hypothetical protein
VNDQGIESDPGSLHESPDDLVELNEHAHRIIPREVLGVTPGSLADVYMNNVGCPQDDQVGSSWRRASWRRGIWIQRISNATLYECLLDYMARMSKVRVDLSLAEVQRETFLVCGGRETILRI